MPPNGQANRLAQVLAARGVGPETVVAVLMECSALVVALLAVLKAGAAYLPVDPGYPAGLIEFMLANAAPGCVLTIGELAAPPLTACPAYVIYTSGPTGTPKGQAAPHAGIVNRVAWMQAEYGLGAGARGSCPR